MRAHRTSFWLNQRHFVKASGSSNRESIAILKARRSRPHSGVITNSSWTGVRRAAEDRKQERFTAAAPRRRGFGMRNPFLRPRKMFYCSGTPPGQMSSVRNELPDHTLPLKGGRGTLQTAVLGKNRTPIGELESSVACAHLRSVPVFDQS